LTKTPTSPYESDSVLPAYFLSGTEALDLEPDLYPGVVGAILSTETGIVDSQGLVESLEREITDEDYAVDIRGREGDRGEGVVVKGTRVVRIDRDEKGTWIVQLESGWEGLVEGERGEVESVEAKVVVNAAGLGGAVLQEGVVPDSEKVRIYPVKGE
jgi:2-hydroxyglutarate dehydrogenase